MKRAAFRRFICRACGLVYDEAVGDADSGLAPGTRFEDIPDDWACPLCGVTKADFECCAETPPVQQATAAGAVMPRRGGVVVVGGGTAAWAVVERIRSLDPHRPITMVAACAADRYDKPRLSVAFRQAVAVEQLVTESGATAAARLAVRLLAHTHAVGVEARHRRLRTTRGTLVFDELVLAHGAQANRCPGLPDELTWRINDLASYSRLRLALQQLSQGASGMPQVLLVGAGLVGCELANDLALAGHPVTLIEAGPRPLPQATPQQSAALLEAWARLPIRFTGQSQVMQAERISASTVALTLSSGIRLEGTVLISAVGLMTPSRLAQQAGLSWNQGIAVDARTLDTGVPHVHALGDCIAIEGRPQRFIEPIRRQADIIAARICGHMAPAYDAAPVPIRVKTSSCPLTLHPAQAA